MKLYVDCKKCMHRIPVSHSVNDRAELAMKIGADFVTRCDKCQNQARYKINEVQAEASKLIAIIGFLIFFVGTALVTFYVKDYLDNMGVLTFGGILVIPSVIYKNLINQENDNVSRFNQYRI